MIQALTVTQVCREKFGSRVGTLCSSIGIGPRPTADTITQDGWLRTGDVAAIDEQGFVYIQGRIKDMIISGGENVYPAEIENVILSHPDVVEVAVIGQPSQKWGESPFAIVVPTGPDVSAEAILRLL